MAEESVLVIEELVGAALRPSRMLQLIGPALPLKGAGWGGEMRLVTTWYPGNASEATQHVLGPIELPSEWEGVWKTNRMVSAPSTFTDFESGAQVKITRASTIRDLLEDIFRTAALLRVYWQQGERKIVRYGRAQRWQFNHDRMDDINWSIGFQWTRRGGAQQRVVTLRSEKTAETSKALADLASQLIAIIDLSKIASINRTVIGSADIFSLGDLEALLDAPIEFMNQYKRISDQIVNRIQHLANIAFKVVGLPDALLGQVINAAVNAASALSQIIDEASRLPAELAASREAGGIAVLRAGKYLAAAESRAGTAASIAKELERRARKRLAAAAAQSADGKAGVADMLAVHVAKEGETFASISVIYYDVPDNGPKIAKANGFPIYQIAPPSGYPLIIPNAAALASIDSV